MSVSNSYFEADPVGGDDTEPERENSLMMKNGGHSSPYHEAEEDIDEPEPSYSRRRSRNKSLSRRFVDEKSMEENLVHNRTDSKVLINDMPSSSPPPTATTSYRKKSTSSGKKTTRKNSVLRRSYARNVVDDKGFLEFYRRAADLKERFNFDLSIPEFVLVGIQSTGKSSCLSQFLQMSVGFIQAGTGTRQPVRYSVRYDADCETPEIAVNGKKIDKVEELPLRLAQIMKPLENQDVFSAEKIQVDIRTNRAPDMVLIDLPGLVIAHSTREQMNDVKELVGNFLNDRNLDTGEFSYVPLVILKAQDPQTDPTFPLLDEICEGIRDGWKRDAVFVVNQIDLFNHHFQDASHVIRYFELLKACVGDGSVIACSMNPKGKVLAPNVDFKSESELHEYLSRVPEYELPVLDDMFAKYSSSAEPHVRRRLMRYRDRHCGIGNMRYIIQQKIKNIVHRIRPSIALELEIQHKELLNQLELLRQARNLADPNVLSRRFANFVEYVFTVKRMFENGEYLSTQFMAESQLTVMQDWRQEMEAFSDHYLSDCAKQWASVFYLDPDELEHVLDVHPDGDYYKALMETPLRGSMQFTRAFHMWRIMFSRMDFAEDYKKPQFVLKVAVALAGKMNPDFWKTVRNVLDRATKPLEYACEWLGSYFRWRFCTDFKEIVHHVTHADENKEFAMFGAETFQPCLELIFDGYNRCVNTLVDEFEMSVKYNRNDSIRIIDEHQVNTFISTADSMKPDNEEKQEEDFVYMTPAQHVNVDTTLASFPSRVVITAENHFRVIRYLVLEDIKGKVLHRVLYHVVEHAERLRNACMTGVLDTKTKDHVVFLAMRYKMSPDRLRSLLESHSDVQHCEGYMINQDALLKRCGFDLNRMDTEIDEAEAKLEDFIGNERLIRLSLQAMEDASRNFDVEGN